MGKILPKAFFERKTETVAKELLGKKLVRKTASELEEFMITEVEAYIGPHDLACHASKGRTSRTEVMFDDAGIIYIYLIYGLHFMLNIVTEKNGYPAAVLIRGVKNISGPGRVTRQLQIDKKLNGLLLSKKTGLWIEEMGINPDKKDILAGPRVGVEYAGPLWANKKLRYRIREDYNSHS